jgi:hypothetical protein
LWILCLDSLLLVLLDRVDDGLDASNGLIDSMPGELLYFDDLLHIEDSRELAFNHKDLDKPITLEFLVAIGPSDQGLLVEFVLEVLKVVSTQLGRKFFGFHAHLDLFCVFRLSQDVEVLHLQVC